MSVLDKSLSTGRGMQVTGEGQCEIPYSGLFSNGEHFRRFRIEEQHTKYLNRLFVRKFAPTKITRYTLYLYDSVHCSS